jgi:hypothetical protein
MMARVRLERFKVLWGKAYHMAPCWLVVNNAPKCKLGYTTYMNNFKNDKAGVAVVH